MLKAALFGLVVAIAFAAFGAIELQQFHDRMARCKSLGHGTLYCAVIGVK